MAHFINLVAACPAWSLHAAMFPCDSLERATIETAPSEGLRKDKEEAIYVLPLI